MFLKNFRKASVTLATLLLGGVSTAAAMDICWAGYDPPRDMFCKTSAHVQSGAGSANSAWQTVANDPHPGYKLVTAAFWLQGPHPCQGTESSLKVGGKAVGSGRWAECVEDKRDTEKAFRSGILAALRVFT